MELKGKQVVRNIRRWLQFSESRKPRRIGIASLEHHFANVTSFSQVLVATLHLMNVTFRGDDVQGFVTEWDEVVLSMKETPKDDMLESM